MVKGKRTLRLMYLISKAIPFTVAGTNIQRNSLHSSKRFARHLVNHQCHRKVKCLLYKLRMKENYLVYKVRVPTIRGNTDEERLR